MRCCWRRTCLSGAPVFHASLCSVNPGPSSPVADRCAALEPGPEPVAGTYVAAGVRCASPATVFHTSLCSVKLGNAVRLQSVLLDGLTTHRSCAQSRCRPWITESADTTLSRPLRLALQCSGPRRMLSGRELRPSLPTIASHALPCAVLRALCSALWTHPECSGRLDRPGYPLPGRAPLLAPDVPLLQLCSTRRCPL